MNLLIKNGLWSFTSQKDVDEHAYAWMITVVYFRFQIFYLPSNLANFPNGWTFWEKWTMEFYITKECVFMVDAHGWLRLCTFDFKSFVLFTKCHFLEFSQLSQWLNPLRKIDNEFVHHKRTCFHGWWLRLRIPSTDKLRNPE